MEHSATSPRQRPRSRGFSFKSDRSSGSRPRTEHLTESPDDKRRRDSIWKNSSKANPNAAITEAQPGDAQLLEQATLGSLRKGQHLDANGNVITDPDLSNPTRPRLERPLDTIRSFEKAIDSGYKRRNSMMRGESYDQNQQYQSRRNSSFNAGGNGGGYESNRYSQGAAMSGGYYGGPVQPPGGGQRRPIPLGGGAGAGGDHGFSAPPRGSLPSTARPEPEKKKSWLKRRFSKKE